MDVKILGTGCPKCQALEALVRQVAELHRIGIDVEKVTDLDGIMSYGVMMTPALVVDEEVKSVGSIPDGERILQWLKREESK